MRGILIGIIGYIVITFGLSVYSARKTKKQDANLITGEKNYGPVVTALSMGTTLASGFAFIGLVGMGYTLGIVATWQAIFGTILEFCCWYFLARKLRTLVDMTDVMTPVEAMAKLHGDPKNLIKIIGGLFIGTFMLFYLAGQFTAGTKAAVTMGLDPTMVAIIVAVLTILYIFLGGMDAAMWTNAIQGFIMLFAFAVTIVIALTKVGGFNQLFATLSVQAPELIQWNNGKGYGEAAFYIANYWLGSAMGFLAQPQAIQKYLTIGSIKDIPKSAVLSNAFNVARQLGPVLIGMCCRVIYPNLADPEAGIPQLIVDFMPNIFGGILMAGIFAAIMSTTETLLLHGASEICRNFMAKGILHNKSFSDKFYARAFRVITVLLGVGGLYISLNGSSGVFNLIIFAWTGLFTSVGPSLYCGLYWKKCTSWGILAGIITGIPATSIWYSYIKPVYGFHEAYSVIISITAVIVVSLLTKDSTKGEKWIDELNLKMLEP